MGDRSAANDELALAVREQIRARARALGFARVGFAGAEPLPGAGALRRWIDAGMHGEMAFIADPTQPRHDPRALLPEARSLIVVAASYGRGGDDPAPGDTPVGRIARYARGADYHRVLRTLLERLAGEIATLTGEPLRWRATVDSAPLLERAAAVAAGLGFIGKSSLLIAPGVGSLILLGELLVDLALPPDRPQRSRCGDCERCIEACPTGAIVAPGVVDARRCISYLTIEQRGRVDPVLIGKTGDWVFGCDRCQEVCPFNHPTPTKRALPRVAALAPSCPPGVPLEDLLTMRAGAYRRLVRDRALRRAPAPSWRRNAALAALAAPVPLTSSLVAALRIAAEDRDAVVRDLARRALARADGSGAAEPPG